MTRWRSAAFLATAVLCVVSRAARGDDEALRVCLDANVPPWSIYDKNAGSGFDLAVADAVSSRLGRRLAIQWFESKADADSSTTLAANALLSDHRCRLVGGYPLIESALGEPGMKSARLPDFIGPGPGDRRRSIELGALAPSRAYHFATLTVVLNSAVSAHIGDLASLEGIRLGVEAGTLADAILMLFGDGRLVNWITHVVPGQSDLLPRLENGDYDATLVELRRFDAYRLAHPQTRLRASGYYFPAGFNIGFVGLATDRPLLDRASQAISKMLDEGALAALAREAGITYLPPRQPNVSSDLTMADLRRN
jgi:ABC-type amino acid transport substrate-binding protein